MANLSSFFGDPASGGGSSNQQQGILSMFGAGNGTYTIPAGAQYVAYGVVGAGGGAQAMTNNSGCCSNPDGPGGAGGGFSYHEMDISGAGAITACYKVGVGGCFARCDCKATCSDGEPTCICGDSTLTTICATGGHGACKCVSMCGGSGNGGMVNNCGGGVFTKNPNEPGGADSNTGANNLSCILCCNNAIRGGGGAGGFIGQGGCGGTDGGGGSGNGGGGGPSADGRIGAQPGKGPQGLGHGSRGVDQLRTGDSLWRRAGYGQVCDTCQQNFDLRIYEPAFTYHIPGTMLCNTTRYSMGKQIFGAASASDHHTSPRQSTYINDAMQLPGAGGFGGNSNSNPSCIPGMGGFMAGGGGGPRTVVGCNGGCGGGAGGTQGCTHPDCGHHCAGGAACCNIVPGAGGDGVAFIEYWLT